MKVAIFSELPMESVNGVVTFINNLTRTAQSIGHSAFIVAPDARRRHTIEPRFSTAELLTTPGLPLFPQPELRIPLPVRGLSTILDRFEPEIVHAFQPTINGTLGIRYARRRSIPVVASYMANLHQYTSYYGVPQIATLVWLVTRMCHNLADVVLSPAESVSGMLRANGVRNVVTLPFGVDAELFAPDRFDQDIRSNLLGQSTARAIAVCVSRLSKEKNLRLLLPIAQDPNIRLVIIGDGPERKALETFYRGTGTLFAGYRFGEELASILASSDVFVFPSSSETFGQVVLEAMSCALPVVGVDSPGVGDQIKASGAGVVCPPNNSFALHQAALDLLADNRHRGTLARNARAYALSNCWKMVTEQMFRIYSDLVEGQSFYVD